MYKFLVNLSCILCFGCNHQPTDQQIPNLDTSDLGYALSKQHCGGCHTYPDPSLLPQDTWKDYVLPRMGYMMGIFEHDSVRQQLLNDGNAREHLLAMDIFPAQNTIDMQSWAHINSYYLDNAPQTLEASSDSAISQELNMFKVKYPNTRLSPPSTTMVKILEDNKLLVADAHTNGLLVFDQKLGLLQVAKVGEAATMAIQQPEAYTVTVMGSFSPTDQTLGRLISLPRSTSQSTKIIIDSLQRPVHTSVADFDADGLDDLVVCEFGKWTGALNLYMNLGRDQYQKRTLINRSGAIKTEVLDLNHDGHLDILVLFGQSNEGFYALYNDGSGNFQQEQILRFESSYGSSSFELVDFNTDGLEDIIYTAGDNADYPPVRKPYHGIYIFLNRDNGKFEQHYFYSYPGAYGTRVRDFDQDGDLDIATISFFPDYNMNDKGFLFLENLGQTTFDASTFQTVDQGRWMVMDCGDLDHDGDLDIVLGSLAFEVVGHPELVNYWAQQGLPFVLLENQLY